MIYSLPFWNYKKAIGAVFFSSLIVGVGLSFGNIYFFHIVLILVYSFILLYREHRDSMWVIVKKPLNLLLFMIFFWSLLSCLWSENKTYALVSLVHFTIGILAVLLVQFFMDTKSSFVFYKNKVLYPIFLLILLLSLLEIFTNFRWPISSLSSYNDWFGRENIIMNILKTERIIGYVDSSPTVFFWNPNNLAVFLCLFLPFLNKNSWLNGFLYLTTIFVIYNTGSRLSIISIGLVLLIICLFKFSTIRFLVYYLSILILPIIFFPNSIAAIKANEPIERIIGINLIPIIGLNYNEGPTVKDTNDNSKSIRKQLYKQGLQDIIDSKLLGVGVGNAEWYNFKRKEHTQNITSVHFYWLELFINGGVVALLLFAGYFSQIAKDLYRLRTSETTIAMVTAAIIFSIAVISMSSANYFLPYYGFLGVLQSWITCNQKTA